MRNYTSITQDIKSLVGKLTILDTIGFHRNLHFNKLILEAKDKIYDPIFI